MEVIDQSTLLTLPQPQPQPQQQQQQQQQQEGDDASVRSQSKDQVVEHNDIPHQLLLVAPPQPPSPQPPSSQPPSPSQQPPHLAITTFPLPSTQPPAAQQIITLLRPSSMKTVYSSSSTSSHVKMLASSSSSSSSHVEMLVSSSSSSGEHYPLSTKSHHITPCHTILRNNHITTLFYPTRTLSYPPLPLLLPFSTLPFLFSSPRSHQELHRHQY